MMAAPGAVPVPSIAGVALPPQDLRHIQWHAPAALSESGVPSTPGQIMAYFAYSPFFDRKCTNLQLRMQTMYSEQRVYEGKEEEEALRNFVGVEFVVREGKQPGLWFIEKRQRVSADEVYPLATYYYLRGNVYQAPSIHAVIAARLTNTLHTLQNLLDLARAKRPAWDPHNGYNWKIREPVAAHTSEGVENVGDEASKQAEWKGECAMDIDGPPVYSNGDDSSTPTAATAATSSASQFNPLLVRALQTTFATFATSAPVAPPPPSHAHKPPARKREQSASAAVEAPVSAAARGGEKGEPPVAGAVVAAESVKKTVKVGATGKRKPRQDV